MIAFGICIGSQEKYERCGAYVVNTLESIYV